MVAFGRTRSRDRSRGHGGLPSPVLPPLASLYARYRADQGITIATGVSQWNDISGNSRHLTQGTALKQPGFSASGIGGKPTVTFASQYLDCAAGTFGTIAQPATMIVVGYTAQAAAAEEFFDNITAGATRQILYGSNTGGAKLAMFAGTAQTVAATLTSASILGVQFNGASSALYQSNSQTPLLTANAGAQTLSGIEVGAGGGGVSPLAGGIAELIICTSALSASDMLAVFSYCGRRYGLAYS